MKKINNILIVGAGFAGSVIARELAEKNYNITIIDSRNHIGGNMYDYKNKYGILIHKYGPHLFHTNDDEVFNWLSRFTEWIEYKHKVKLLLENGDYATLPVNRETQERIGKENIIDVIYKPYTLKMWGKTLEELDPGIVNRVKIRNDDNEYYFPDEKYQYMPKEGYTKLFENILNHKNIIVKINTAFNKESENDFDYIFNSMSIDEYYNYKFGMLEYRSIKFTHKNIYLKSVLPVMTVNFTDYSKFTRISEWKKLPYNCNSNYTTLTLEAPCDYSENNFQRYYPVKDINKNNEIKYNKYLGIANNKVKFIGRCGKYKYFNMDEVIKDSLNISKEY